MDSQHDEVVRLEEGDKRDRILPEDHSQLSSRDRFALLSHMMGEPQAWTQGFVDAVYRMGDFHYDKHILPLVRQHWPEIENERFGRKLRFVTQTYTTMPFMLMLCSKERPFALSLAVKSGKALNLSPPKMSRVAEFSMGTLGRVVAPRMHRHVVLVSAFVAAIDETFDHLMDEPGYERAQKMRAILAGDLEPDSNALRFVMAIKQQMLLGLKGVEKERCDAFFDRVKAWTVDEAKSMEGVTDPTGICFRLAGIEAGVDGVMWPVLSYCDDKMRAWMIEAGIFTQMMDDWLDYEKDARFGRPSPVTEGTWTYESIDTKWKEVCAGILELAKDAKLDSEMYLSFIESVYTRMGREVMEAMADGLAA